MFLSFGYLSLGILGLVNSIFAPWISAYLMMATAAAVFV